MFEKIGVDVNKDYIRLTSLDKFSTSSKYAKGQKFFIDKDINTREYFVQARRCVLKYMEDLDIKLAELTILLPYDMLDTEIVMEEIPRLKKRHIEKSVKNKVKDKHKDIKRYAYKWKATEGHKEEEDGFDIYNLLWVAAKKEVFKNVAELTNVNINIKGVFFKPLTLINYAYEDRLILDTSTEKFAGYLYNQDSIIEINEFKTDYKSILADLKKEVSSIMEDLGLNKVKEEVKLDLEETKVKKEDLKSKIKDLVTKDLNKTDTEGTVKEVEEDLISDLDLKLILSILEKEEFLKLNRNKAFEEKNLEEKIGKEMKEEVEERDISTATTPKELSLEEKLAKLKEEKGTSETTTVEETTNNSDLDTEINTDTNIDAETKKEETTTIEEPNIKEPILDTNSAKEEVSDDKELSLEVISYFYKINEIDEDKIKNILLIVEKLKPIYEEQLIETINFKIKNLTREMQRYIRSVEVLKSPNLKTINYIYNTEDTIVVNKVIKDLKDSVTEFKLSLFANAQLGKEEEIKDFPEYFYSQVALGELTNLKELNLKQFARKDFDYLSFGLALLLSSITFNIGLSFTSKRIEKKITQLEDIRSEQSISINTLEEKLDEYNHFIDSHQKIITMSEEITDQQKWLSEILYLLPSRTPKELSIKNINIQTDNIVLKGYSKDYVDIGWFVMELEPLGDVELESIENSVQEGVAVGKGEVEEEDALKLDKTFTITIRFNNSNFKNEDYDTIDQVIEQKKDISLDNDELRKEILKGEDISGS